MKESKRKSISLAARIPDFESGGRSSRNRHLSDICSIFSYGLPHFLIENANLLLSIQENF